MTANVKFACPKCGATSGDDWSQCHGVCPIVWSPYYGMTKHITDHARGCEGRTHTCTCGYDAERDADLTALREENEQLRAACNQARLAFSGMVSVQSAIDVLDKAPANATAALSAAPAVGVKALKWLADYNRQYAYALFGGTYIITEYAGMSEPFSLEARGFSGSLSRYFPTLEAAKAAAQSDYEARIRSALTTDGKDNG